MHGLFVLDKPAGLSSAGALGPLKSALGPRVRVGHAGTLDPFATGVLLVLVGDATRLFGLAAGLAKTYEATVLFGEETDTLDPEGERVRTADPGPCLPPELDAALSRFRGEIEQVPPAYSALKVAGRRAYRLARAGRPPDLAPRRVRIHELRRLDAAWPRVRFLVRCGTGTYVRSLGRDLGAALGLPARLDELRRTEVGPFGLDASISLPPGGRSDLAAIRDRLLPPLMLARAAGLPLARLDREAARPLALGGSAPAPAGLAAGEERPVGVVAGGRLLALARLDPEGRLRPFRVLASARERLLAGPGEPGPAGG